MKKKCKCRVCGTEGVFAIYQMKEMMRGIKKIKNNFILFPFVFMFYK